MDRPRWRIVDARHELWLVPWGSGPVAGAERLPAAEARRRLAAALAGERAWGFAARAVLECARHLGRPAPAFERAAEVLYDAIGSGRVVVWRGESRRVAAPVGELDEDAGGAVPLATMLLPKTWVEIELTDMEGNPRHGERYWIKLPDGTVREGALDAYGRAYFGDLDPGACEIRWPDLDEEATVAVGRADSAPTRRELTWIEIELTDMDGNPRPGERYWIKFPDGLVRVGRLDGAGRARFVRLVPGDCEIRWPDLDEEATIPALDPTFGAPAEEVRAPRAPAARPGAEAPRGPRPLVVAPPPQLDPEAQAAVLVQAAREGVPFCEECARAARAAGSRA